MQISLTKTRFVAGTWEGVVAGAAGSPEPGIVVSHMGDILPNYSMEPVADMPGHWALCIPVPPDVLGDGVHTFLISDEVTGVKLGSFCIISGEPMDDDIRADIDLLRAELDMLKKAFRRHCLETAMES